jgi:hypothetical protein
MIDAAQRGGCHEVGGAAGVRRASGSARGDARAENGVRDNHRYALWPFLQQHVADEAQGRKTSLLWSSKAA